MTEETNGGQPAALGFDITGKRVVVVGGKTGAGLGIAQAAHAAGAAVVVVASRRSFSEADHPELADFEQIALDVEDEDAVRVAFKAIGALDHLVVAAGPAMGTWGAFSDTDMRGVRQKVREKFPVRRVGTPAAVGHAAVFLMTNPYVTGTVIEVSGGELLVGWVF